MAGLGNGSAELRREFGGEERLFRVSIGPLRKIQENTGAGPLQLAARFRLAAVALRAMAEGDYATLARMDLKQVGEKADQREVILQALLGAKEVSGPEALKLVRDWVEERPQVETLDLAEDLCLAAVVGTEDEPLGERPGEVRSSPTSPTDASASATSTPPASPPASAPARSTTSRSGNSATPSPAGRARRAPTAPTA